MKVIVSSCLLGKKVKYNGSDNFKIELSELLKKYKLEIKEVCPEVLGGLSIPRVPAEINREDVLTKSGKSVYKEFKIGANVVLNLAQEEEIKLAILKEKSPSCGSNYIYDGSFSKNLIKGEGITTKILRENDIKVYSENDLEKIELFIQKHINK